MESRVDRAPRQAIRSVPHPFPFEGAGQRAPGSGTARDLAGPFSPSRPPRRHRALDPIVRTRPSSSVPTFSESAASLQRSEPTDTLVQQAGDSPTLRSWGRPCSLRGALSLPRDSSARKLHVDGPFAQRTSFDQGGASSPAPVHVRSARATKVSDPDRAFTVSHPLERAVTATPFPSAEFLPLSPLSCILVPAIQSGRFLVRGQTGWR